MTIVVSASIANFKLADSILLTNSSAQQLGFRAGNTKHKDDRDQPSI
jgi:hypothetical protein